MKFKFEKRRAVIASDGESFANEVDAQWHETKRIVRQLMSSTEEEILDAFQGRNEIARFNILTLASLLRPPRVMKRKGQSEAGPTAPSTTESVSTTVQTAPEATDVAGHDQPPVAAAPSEQPEAAGVSPAPAASDSPDARAPSEQEARMDAYQHGKVDASAGAEPRGHKRGKREGAAT